VVLDVTLRPMVLLVLEFQDKGIAEERLKMTVQPMLLVVAVAVLELLV
jgi:hypothetical protein